MKAKRDFFVCLLLSLFLAACGGGGGGSDGGNGTTPPVTPELPSVCSGGDNGGGTGVKKLLVRVVTEGEGERTFQYDSQNRLIADSALGVGNKIEYEGDNRCPSLVTNGNSPFAPYDRYQYGTDGLLGEPTKYYQTQPLNQKKNPLDPDVFYRHYLDSNDREIVYGAYHVSGNNFPLYQPFNTYDERGNLLKWRLNQFAPMGGAVTFVAEYTYDEKKGSASGMVTPLWWFENASGYFSDDFLANPNNPLTRYTVTSTFGGVVIRIWGEIYSYTYDQDGYPTTVDVTKTSRDSQGIELTTGSYRRTFEYIPAH
jgi:hypothetical protein